VPNTDKGESRSSTYNQVKEQPESRGSFVIYAIVHKARHISQQTALGTLYPLAPLALLDQPGAKTNMGGLLGGGGDGGGGLLSGVTDTVNQTTKGLPIVGGVTEPLLDTVGGVTDELPIVGRTGEKKSVQGQQPQAPTQGQDPEAAASAKKKQIHAMKKRQLALDMEEMEMDGK